MDIIQTILTILSLIISFGTVCTLLYGFSKFISKPHDTLEAQVKDLQEWRQKVDNRLDLGNRRFEAQDEANRVTQGALLALIDKEIKDCALENKPVPDELSKARKDLYDYLTDKRGG